MDTITGILPLNDDLSEVFDTISELLSMMLYARTDRVEDERTVSVDVLVRTLLTCSKMIPPGQYQQVAFARLRQAISLEGDALAARAATIAPLQRRSLASTGKRVIFDHDSWTVIDEPRKQFAFH